MQAKTRKMKQDAQRAQPPPALLDAAAVEFNARGIAGARLAQIGAAAGIKRSALYYYFDSREDLAFRCYLRECRQVADDLAAARTADDGLARLHAYLRRALDAARPPAVVLSEIPYLGHERRRRVEAELARNMRTLTGFVEEGIADGSIRACNARVAAQAIYGMVVWVPLAGEWVVDAGADVRRHAAAALWDLVQRGTAAHAGADVRCTLEVNDFAFRHGNAFDRREASALKVELLVQTASRLFNRHGIDGTSLDDITAELGATKGAFYHHITEKKALVLRCAQRAFDLYDRFADAAETHGRNGLERSMIGLHLNVQAQASALSPLSPLTGLEVLPARSLKDLRARSLRVEQRFEAFNHGGIRDGSLRRFDVRTLSLAGAGAFGWISKWYDEAQGPSPRELADEMVNLFVHGLRSSRR
ncbi:MAG TPA: TetR family transcriptional regulator [Nevskiaceae bacterium]|nr:TetR family transcriptional regulator [Nevskiaceae bacterium]